MKTFVLALGLLVSASAIAADQPVIVKSSGAGFAPAAYVRSESCEVYLDRVEIKKGFGIGEGGFAKVEVRKIALSPSIKGIVTKAAQEEVKTTDNGICDAPSTSVRANGQTDQVVELFSSGGCGQGRRERVGPYTSMLREVVDEYCPKTFDFRKPDDGGAN